MHKMKTDREEWEDYILNRFSDTTQFVIKAESYDISVSSADRSVKTTLCFIFSDTELMDIQFYSGLTSSFSGEYSSGEALEFSKSNVEWIEKNWLQIPLENGWKEKEYFFVSSKPYKSLVYYDKSKTKSDFTEYHSFLGPLIWLLTLGGLLAIKTETIVPPIITDRKTSTNA